MQNLYLFLGEEFLRERAITQKVGEIKHNSAIKLGEARLDGENLSLGKLLEELGTSTLFADGKVILIRNADRLSSQERLAAYLERARVPKDFYLIFSADKLDRKSKLYKAIEKYGEIKDLGKVDRRNLPLIIKELLHERSVKLTPQAFRYFLEVSGDLRRIANEISKLAQFSQGRQLSAEELEELIFGRKGSSIFQFLDSLGERNLGCLKALKELLDSGEEPNKIFFMIASHMRSLLAIKSLAEAGYSNEEIAERTGQYSWLVAKKRAQAKNFSEKELIEALHLLHQEDSKIKRGEKEPEESLFDLVLFFSKSES